MFVWNSKYYICFVCLFQLLVVISISFLMLSIGLIVPVCYFFASFSFVKINLPNFFYPGIIYMLFQQFELFSWVCDIFLNISRDFLFYLNQISVTVRLRSCFYLIGIYLCSIYSNVQYVHDHKALLVHYYIQYSFLFVCVCVFMRLCVYFVSFFFICYCFSFMLSFYLVLIGYCSIVNIIMRSNFPPAHIWWPTHIHKFIYMLIRIKSIFPNKNYY